MFPVHWIYTFILRLLNGIFTFIAQTIAPSWLADLSPSENKSVLNKYFELFIAVGILINNLLLFIVSDNAQWYRIAFLHGLIVSILSAVLSFLQKESEEVELLIDEKPKQKLIFSRNKFIAIAIALPIAS